MPFPGLATAFRPLLPTKGNVLEKPSIQYSFSDWLAHNVAQKPHDARRIVLRFLFLNIL